MKHYVFTAALVVVFIFWVVRPILAINRISLSQVQASFVGEEAGDWADWVVSLGDVNSDGYDDFLIGATNNDYGGEEAGQAYLIFGKPSGWSLRTSLSETDASFIGEVERGHAGLPVSGAGDVNGDRYGDILISSSGFSSRGEQPRGQTYIIFGKAEGWGMRTDLSQADASYIGENPGDISGSWSAGAGDLNGDGYDDILIGAPFNGFSGDRAGQTYLIFGQPDGWRMRNPLSLADASFVGEHEGDWSGFPVAGGGDANGDGYDDFLIGSHQSENWAGQTYLILGQPDGWSMQTPLSEAAASFIGEEVYDHAGFSVSGAGDVNGDGYDDFLIGAPVNSFSGLRAGQTYLIFGRPTGWSLRTNLSEADASFVGEHEEDWSGSPVAGVGDVNGDGYDDILIGAPGYDNSTGQTYLILGRSGGWKMRMSLSEADVSFIGEDSLDWSGESISGGGDVNGDGLDDILIGALNSYGGQEAGQVYLCLHIPVTITTRTFKIGAVGVPYSERLSATGGTPPYVWNLHSGLLPNGLGLDSTGVILGVPSTVDTANFTVRVTDATPDTNLKDFTIIITKAAKGDVNGDGQINILDVVLTVNIILELFDPTPTQRWAADCNQNETVNVLDLVGMVNVILGTGTCPP